MWKYYPCRNLCRKSATRFTRSPRYMLLKAATLRKAKKGSDKESGLVSGDPQYLENVTEVCHAPPLLIFREWVKLELFKADFKN